MGAAGPVDSRDLDLSASSYRSYDSLVVGATKAGQSWWSITPPGVGGEDALPLEFEPYGIFPELPYIMTAAALVLMSGIARLRTPGTEAARQAAIRR